MIQRKFISFIALFVIAFAFTTFASASEPAKLAPSFQVQKSAMVKFPPNVSNSFRQKKIIFVIENDFAVKPPILRLDNKFLIPSSDYRGFYRVAFRPPDKITVPQRDARDQVIDGAAFVHLNVRPKPKIVRMI